MNKTAIIIGATGLVGSNLLRELLMDDYFSVVKVFGRRSTGVEHEKLQEFLVDFDLIPSFSEAITGDVLFSCLGTTLKLAGSKKAQYKVDYTYQYEFAKQASDNGVASYLLVSSASANPASLFFYTRIKGALEAAIKQLTFAKTRIVQPSVLSGERNKTRIAEVLAAKFIDKLSGLFPFLKKYRSISGGRVAKAMVAIYKKDDSDKIKSYTLDDLFYL